MLYNFVDVMKSAHDHVRPKQEVVNSLMELENDFNVLLRKVRKIVMESKVNVSEVKFMFFENDEFECDSFEHVMNKLLTDKRICTFNVKPLHKLAGEDMLGCDHEVKEIIEAYEKKKEEFFNSTLALDFVCVILEPLCDDPNLAKLKIKIPMYYSAEKRTLKDVETLAKKAFEIHFDSFVDLQVEIGSICIIWRYPKHLTSVLKQSVKTDLLIKGGVEELIIDGETVFYIHMEPTKESKIINVISISKFVLPYETINPERAIECNNQIIDVISRLEYILPLLISHGIR